MQICILVETCADLVALGPVLAVPRRSSPFPASGEEAKIAFDISRNTKTHKSTTFMKIVLKKYKSAKTDQHVPGRLRSTSQCKIRGPRTILMRFRRCPGPRQGHQGVQGHT